MIDKLAVLVNQDQLKTLQPEKVSMKELAIKLEKLSQPKRKNFKKISAYAKCVENQEKAS